MTSPNTEALRNVSRHDTYYISGADLCFLVAGVHFRVHRYFFERESRFFINELAVPATPGQQPRGTQDSNAILIDNVTAEHFATFLWVFYNPRYSLYDAKVSDWEVILSLAVRWEFPEVKNLAVRELEKKELSDSKRIKLYHENHVDRNILLRRYAALCEREADLTLEEGHDIGLETVLMIAAGRLQVRASPLATGGRSPLSPTFTGDKLHDVVREIFRIDPESSSTEKKDNTDNSSGTPNTNPNHDLSKKMPNGTNGTNTDTTVDPSKTEGKGKHGQHGNKKTGK